MPDLASVDASVTAMESRVQDIRRCLQEELDAIPKAKVRLLRSIHRGNAGDRAFGLFFEGKSSLSLDVPPEADPPVALTEARTGAINCVEVVALSLDFGLGMS